MKLHVLGSDSSGNSYLLITETGQVLILECGVPLKKIKEHLNFDLSKITSCLLTHRHGDHAKYANEYMKAGIEVCSSVYTHDELEFSHRMRFMDNKKRYQVGEFEVMPFEVKHDVHCFAFLIKNPESGLIVFITDTMYCPFKFPDTNQWIIEANYSQAILDSRLHEAETIEFVRNRVVQSHMSLETAKEVLKANDLSKVNNIVLIHLSDGNSDQKLFVNEIQSITGKNVFAAKSGMCIDFNITPF